MRVARVLVFAMGVALCASQAWAQTPTATATPTAMVTSTPAITGVYRMGVNLGQQNVQDQAFMQDWFDNPGFEPPTDGHIIVINSGATTSTFQDVVNGGGAVGPLGTVTTAPNNYWIGAEASVRTGAAAGDLFTVTGYTLDTNGFCSNSLTTTCTLANYATQCGTNNPCWLIGDYAFGSCENASGGSISCPTLGTGVGVAEVLTSVAINTPLNGFGGTPWDSPDGNCVLSTTDHSEGQGSVACNVADGATHSIDYGWDTEVTTGGVCSNDNVTPCTVANQTADCGGSNTCLQAPQAGPWHPVNGAFEIAFYAKGATTSTGTPAVTAAVSRTGLTCSPSCSHSFTLTNDGAWHHYTYQFTGTESGFTGGANLPRLDFEFTQTNGSAEAGATIYLDDVYFGRQTTTTTGFRSEVVTSLQPVNPGSLRYGAYQQLATNDGGYEGASGCTAGNSGPTTTGTCDYLHGPAYINSGGGAWTYAAQDTYAIAGTLGSVPWMTIGNTMSDADLVAFTDRLCTAINTYGFSSAWIEQSNEEWLNGPGRISYGSHNLGQLGYGGATGRNFSIMSAEATSDCPSVASRIHYIIGNQVCNGGVVATEIAGASAAGFAIPNTGQYGTDDAPYNTETLPIYSGSLSSQAAQYASYLFGQIPPVVGSSGCIETNDYPSIGASNFLDFYEMGPGAGTAVGYATSEQLYLSEGGFPSAAWMAETYVLGQQLGTPIQNEYQLGQVEYNAAPIWGIAHDMDSDFGPSFPHLRPIALGMEVMNSADRRGLLSGDRAGDWHLCQRLQTRLGLERRTN